MKKLSIFVLSLTLIFGLSAVAMADASGSTEGDGLDSSVSDTIDFTVDVEEWVAISLESNQLNMNLTEGQVSASSDQIDYTVKANTNFTISFWWEEFADVVFGPEDNSYSQDSNEFFDFEFGYDGSTSVVLDAPAEGDSSYMLDPSKYGFIDQNNFDWGRTSLQHDNHAPGEQTGHIALNVSKPDDADWTELVAGEHNSTVAIVVTSPSGE